MLLLLVLCTATIFYPALSQPVRSDMIDENDYPMPFYRARGEWGEAMDRPHKGMDIAHMIKDLEAMRYANLYPQQGRSGKLVDSSGAPFKPGKRMVGAGKRNFDEIDRSGFNGFVKKNFDEIDRSGFNSLVKKNFDEIDRAGFNGFVKKNFDEIDRSGFNGFIKKNMNHFENSYR